MKRCAIITGGKYSELELIEKCEYIICCDLGYKYCLENKIVPDLLIGDFDSYSGALPQDILTITLPVEKDDTDTMFAFKKAIEMEFEEIYLYCALGNRLDHTIANLQCLNYAALNNVRTYIYDKDNYIIASNAGEIKLKEKKGYSLSFFAFDKCEGVSIKGTKYEVNDIEVTNGFPIGQSNKWASEMAIYSVKKGTFIIICSKMAE